MEVTLETKIQLFAQYLGQPIRMKALRGSFKIRTCNFTTIQLMEEGDVLILKPLSKITDEDVLKVGRLAETVETMKIHGEKRLAFFRNNLPFLIEKTKIYQYLQGQGYDLPHYLLTDKECGGVWRKLSEVGLCIYEIK
jgi:hypothetical protein